MVMAGMLVRKFVPEANPRCDDEADAVVYVDAHEADAVVYVDALALMLLCMLMLLRLYFSPRLRLGLFATVTECAINVMI